VSLFLLDTNILTELARNPFGASSHKLKVAGSHNTFTSIIVAGEVRYGIQRHPAMKLLRQMEQIMETIEIRPLPLSAIDTYSVLRTSLDSRSLPISGNDMWIAAHAIAEDAVLVSNNIREFSRIPNLKVENWMHTT
jgi:tRNA(fMet)-specific endonuclease VapC